MNLAVHVPYASEPALVSPGHDHTFVLRVEAIRANAAGTFLATLRGDAVPRAYTVAQGEVIAGLFVQIVYEHNDTVTTLTNASDLLGLAYTAQPAH